MAETAPVFAKRAAVQPGVSGEKCRKRVIFRKKFSFRSQKQRERREMRRIFGGKNAPAPAVCKKIRFPVPTQTQTRRDTTAAEGRCIPPGFRVGAVRKTTVPRSTKGCGAPFSIHKSTGRADGGLSLTASPIRWWTAPPSPG